jgi:hypothetical protein
MCTSATDVAAETRSFHAAWSRTSERAPNSIATI